MAYKFQLGNAKLGGSLQQDGGLVSTSVDDATAANIVSEIDNGEIPIAKLAAKTISGKDLGTNLDNLTAGDGLSGGTFNGGSAVTFAVDLKNNFGLEFDSGELAAKVDGAKGMEVSSQGLAVKVRNAKGLGFHADGLEIQPSASGGISLDAGGIKVQLQNNKGLEVDAGGLAIDLKANSGLAFTGNEIGVTLANNKGLEFDGAGIAMDIKSNSGLVFDGNELQVSLNSDALDFVAGAIDLKDTIAGNRTFSGDVTVNGALNCDAGAVALFAGAGANTITVGANNSTVAIAGNLSVAGTTTTINSTDLLVADKIIQVAKDANDQASSKDSGLQFGQGNANGARLLYEIDASVQKLKAKQGSGTTLISMEAAEFIGPATQAKITDEENANNDRLIVFADSSGNQALKNDGDFHYNPSTGKVTATAFVGDGSELTGVSASGSPVALKADGNTLAAGFNYIADMTSDGTDVFNLPASPEVGMVVYVKAPSDCSSARIARVSRQGSHTIDGATSIDLVSPHAAVSIIYVAANTWKLF